MTLTRNVRKPWVSGARTPQAPEGRQNFKGNRQGEGDIFPLSAPREPDAR